MKLNAPCHGPVPWPFLQFEKHMTRYMNMVRSAGDRVLPLIALGRGMEPDSFVDLTRDSFVDLTRDLFGHMRVLKFCEKSSTTRGIGAHTDYGMLVFATQNHVGGLWTRPPLQEERVENWKESSAGHYEDHDKWKFIVPEPNVLTCFPGDISQFITKNQLLATPLKVQLANQVRYALAYFHEPSFGAVIRRADTGAEVHYGEHVTNMFMRCYPEKPVTKRIVEQQLKKNLPRTVTSVYTY